MRFDGRNEKKSRSNDEKSKSLKRSWSADGGTWALGCPVAGCGGNDDGAAVADEHKASFRLECCAGSNGDGSADRVVGKPSDDVVAGDDVNEDDGDGDGSSDDDDDDDDDDEYDGSSDADDSLSIALGELTESKSKREENVGSAPCGLVWMLKNPSRMLRLSGKKDPPSWTPDVVEMSAGNSHRLPLMLASGNTG